VIGWDAKDSGMADRSYKLFSAGPMMVGGLMPIPEEARAMGARPAWNGYVLVDDVDVLCRARQSSRWRDSPRQIPKPAKLPPLPESRIRPGCETPAISAGADTRVEFYPSLKLAWSSSGPLAGFYFGVDIVLQFSIAEPFDSVRGDPSTGQVITDSVNAGLEVSIYHIDTIILRSDKVTRKRQPCDAQS
jgi:hypothetical protein